MANITQIDLGVITPIPKGDYSLTTNYERLNLVVYKGSSWIRTDIEPYVIGSIPQTGSLYWQLNASGVSEIPDASLTVKGITKLSNATNSVDETVAATSRAVKSAYDIGSTAVSSATTANNTANSALSIANSTKAITDLVSLTAIAGGIPKADSTGKIDDGWLPSTFLVGGIIMFSGTFGGTDGKRPVPLGATDADESWALCDGSNGTPDLRGRFIIGAGESYAQGTTGGAASAEVSGSVSGTTGATTLTVAQMPSHMHTTPTGLVGGNGSYYFIDGDYGGSNKSSGTDYVGGNSSHTHPMSGSLSATVNTLPPYYALAYIMKLPTA